MLFRTALSFNNYADHCSSGQKIKNTYAPKIHKDGSFELVKKGEFDLYQDIQSHADSVNLNLILARYMAGDKTALVKRVGFFGDVTNAPTTYAEALQSMYDAQAKFAELPKEVRAQFNNDFNHFYASADEPDNFTAKIDAGFALMRQGKSQAINNATTINDDAKKVADVSQLAENATPEVTA